MVEFKIQIEDSLVQTLGYEETEKYLYESVQKVIIRLAAKDILDDLKSIDLTNDEEWQLARNTAWQQEKHKYFA
jgi:hypothetical protein